MRFLRTVSTQRLLAIVAGLILAIAGGTAIAVAASNGGPTPPRESLAKALHQAANAPTVSGITARIKFTNNLIDSSAIQGSDPILSGASGRLWMSTTSHQMRLELQGQNGDAQVVVANGSFSIYDPTSKTLYKGTLPSQGSTTQKTEPIPTVAQIQSNLNQLMQHLNILGPLPRNVAGQPAYKVEVSPKHDGGLLGDVQLAWDAAHGIPLGIAVLALELEAHAMAGRGQPQAAAGSAQDRVAALDVGRVDQVVGELDPGGDAADRGRVRGLMQGRGERLARRSRATIGCRHGDRGAAGDGQDHAGHDGQQTLRGDGAKKPHGDHDRTGS